MYLTSRLVRYEQAEGEIWLNTLSGAVDRLSGEEVGLVDRALGSGGLSDTALRRQLESRGYLFADEASELAAFERLVREHQRDDHDRNVNQIICPTYSCNLRCIYCFERQPHGQLPRMSMDQALAAKALAAFKRIRELEPGRRYSLGLFGGEPLLLANHAVVRGVLASAQAEALPVMIVSNGVNVPGFISILEEYSSAIMAVQLTLDGPEEIHDERRPAAGGQGTFRAVAGAADLLLDKGIKVVLRANVDRKNLKYLPGLTRIARDRGWAGNPAFNCSLAPVKDHLESGTIPDVTPGTELISTLLDVYDSDPDSEALFGFQGLPMLSPVAGLIGDGGTTQPRVYHCEANYGGFWVAGPDGYLYACPEAIGQPELAIGRFAPLLEIWRGARQRWMDRNIGTISRCADCEIGPLCGGGCAYASLSRGREEAEIGCDPGLEGAVGVFLRRRIINSR